MPNPRQLRSWTSNQRATQNRDDVEDSIEMALDWRFNNTGIDDLSATRDKACSLQLATDRRADGFHQIVLLQTLAPEPDGFGIRDLSAVF